MYHFILDFFLLGSLLPAKEGALLLGGGGLPIEFLFFLSSWFTAQICFPPSTRLPFSWVPMGKEAHSGQVFFPLRATVS